MFKNQLQELAQRSCFNLPSYSCIREGPDHAPRFKATVNFNNETFESPMFCTTLRQAEHSAAEVALKELAKRGPSRSLAAKVLDELGVYKNLLQETVHRAGLNLPVYTTVRSGPGHVPVFHANVELAGMIFTGEPAKTKKQAQKNAAMAAWSTLKQMAYSQSSSSSSSSLLSATDRNDEQEQAIIIRFLSTFCPPDAKKSPIQNDRNRGRQRSSPVRCDIKPTNAGVSLHHVQYPSWFYSNYSPEVAMYQMWQEQVAQLQNRTLTVPMAPSSMSGPQILPFIGSIYPSEFAQYFLAREQEWMAVVPQITLPASGPTLHFSNGTIPLQIESRPQVVVQEIQEETTEGKEKKLHGDASMDAGIKPPVGPLAHVDLHGSIPRGFDSSFHLQSPTSAGVAKSCRPSAAPLTIGSVAPVSTVNPRPAILNTRISSPVTIRPVIPTYSGRFRSMNTGGFRSVNCMAPAVQIRSVVPVCSAPPGTAREKPETTTQEGLFSGAERTEEPKHVMAATSDLGKLKI